MILYQKVQFASITILYINIKKANIQHETTLYHENKAHNSNNKIMNHKS